MSDPGTLIERLTSILEALERIPRRFAGVSRPLDFRSSDDGLDRLDAICMTLIAVGEEFKRIDRQTDGVLLARYPQVQWRGVKAVRDVLAHGYFDVDAEQLYDLCRDDIPVLIDAVRTMIRDLRDGPPA